MGKIPLPFKVRYEIAKILLSDNLDKRKEIVEWLLTQNVSERDR